MTVRKIARAVGILTLTVLLLASCVSENVDDLPFISLDTGDEYVITEYRLIISRNASGELMNTAKQFREALAAQTGVDTILNYDDEYINASDGAWFVYIGYVDRYAVKDLLRNMRSDDYICRSVDGATVIGGRSDSSTVVAIERFKKEIMPLSDCYRLIPNEGGFDHTGVYETESLRIDGIDISEFEIVAVDFQDTFAVELAYALRAAVSDNFGFCLDTRIGSRSETERGIYIMTDNSCVPDRGEFDFSGNDIILKAASPRGLQRLADMFLQLLLSDGTIGELSPDIPKHLYMPYGDTECEIATMCSDYTLSFSSVLTYANIGRAADTYSPSIVLFGHTEDDERILLSETLYKYSTVETSYGASFSEPDVSIQSLNICEDNGLSTEVFYIKSGELEFILVYVSGSSSEAVTMDISAIVDDTLLPIVAITHTYIGAEVVLTHSALPYFERVICESRDMYGNNIFYSCYADISRLSVAQSQKDGDLDYRQITVAVP